MTNSIPKEGTTELQQQSSKQTILNKKQDRAPIFERLVKTQEKPDMANRLQMVCVVRKIKGHEEYVPATDVMERGQKFEDGEPMFSGVFDTDIQSDGPSGSDKRRVCIPVGELTRFTAGSCVLREIKPGDTQWVPVAEAGQLRKGERLQVGMFNSDLERCGPSGSHERTVCTATPLVTETTVS